MKKNNKKKIVIALIVTISVILVALGISYALWNITANQETINKLSSDCLELTLTDETDAIKLTNAYPISDEDAEDLTPYTFKIKNVCNLSATYDVNLEIMDIENRLSSEFIALDFNGNGKKLLNNYPSATPTYDKSDYTAIESRGLKTGTLNAGEEITYTIKLWMDESVTIEDDTMNKEFVSKITLNVSMNQVVDAFKEEILNGADPVLADNLIPVVIADDGTVTKANIETEWYNYTNQVWANAVILEDETKTYNNYDVIPESNIESYFVWIPRYKYKIWDEGQYESLTTIDTEKVHTIQVEFESKDIQASTGSTVNSWLTHPAFIAFGTNGIWVGKFESGYKGATSSTTALSNTNEPEKLQIKPNVYSWSEIQLSYAHLTSYNYKRNLDSHMMKNTEWGAVAYLQHSAYGSQKSVRINNNSNHLTGYGALNEPTIGYTATLIDENVWETTNLNQNGNYTFMYNTSIGCLASTTGNISGVYDMSGGSHEYMMSVIADASGNPVSGKNNYYNSGFLGTYVCPTCNSDVADSAIIENADGVEWPDAKYYDLYNNVTNVMAYKNRILGDATGEMGPFEISTYETKTRNIGSWYGDESWFLTSHDNWTVRGGSYLLGTGAGIFNFSNGSGKEASGTTFRVVLAPQN